MTQSSTAKKLLTYYYPMYVRALGQSNKFDIKPLEELARGKEEDKTTAIAQITICILEGLDHIPSKSNSFRIPVNAKEIFKSKYFQRVPASLIEIQEKNQISRSTAYSVLKISLQQFIEGYNSSITKRGFNSSYLI